MISSFTASPATITTGKSTTLSWLVSGAATLSIDQGIGAVTGDSTVVTPPSQSTAYIYTYTLTAQNASGGSVSKTVDVNIVPLEISDFTASPATISLGDSTTLTAVFVGTGASISNGVGAVTSGNGVVVSPSTTTTYTLTVSALLDSVTKPVTVTVVPPAISSFTADPNPVAAGTSTTLTATFANGTGTIEPSIGNVTSGVGVPTPALSASTTYTLTVTNALGRSVTGTVTVDVFVPDAAVPDAEVD